MARIAVLMTCYNRRDVTVICLASLREQIGADVTTTTYLVDDGCTDGTGEAVAFHPNIRVLQGDGNLFWTRGMHLAFERAMQDGHDGYLWLNDDVVLDRDAIARLRECRARLAERAKEPMIVVGSTRDPDSGRMTYGGVVRASALHPLKFARVQPGQVEVEVDTFNGNFVYIPEDTARLVGNLDPGFLHFFGDNDYGLRARALGVRIWLMPGTIGVCRRNAPSTSWRSPGIGIRERWARVKHPARGAPWTYWARFAERHGGPFWFVFACLAYRRLIWPTDRPAVRDAKSP